MLVARMPRERILTESDGPFAQINRRSILPWEVSKAVPVLADLWDNNVSETQQILNSNLGRLTQLQIPIKGDERAGMVPSHDAIKIR